MKIKFCLLFVILFTSSGVFAANPPANPAINKLDVLSGILKDKDFGKYLECSNINAYPVVLQHGEEFFVIASPGSPLQEMSGSSLVDQPVFRITSFKVKENDKVRVKISYLDKKLLVTTTRLYSSKWAIRSLFARQAGGIKPEWFVFK